MKAIQKRSMDGFRGRCVYARFEIGWELGVIGSTVC